jgi:16S rRNA C967 or C1407 C5-methylase (RsmB/RsmF family)
MVIAEFLAGHPEFRAAPPPAAASGSAWTALADPATGFVRSLPHVHGTDGFFVARLVRR